MWNCMIVYNHNVELYDCLHSHYGCWQSHSHAACSDEALCTHHRSFSLCCISNISCFLKGWRGLITTLSCFTASSFPSSRQNLRVHVSRFACLSCIMFMCQKFCHDKHTFVATKDMFCRDKHRFVLTYFCHDKIMFVTTNVLSRHAHFFCRDKNVTCGGFCQWYTGPLLSALCVCLSLCVSSPSPPKMEYCRCRT